MADEAAMPDLSKARCADALQFIRCACCSRLLIVFSAGERAIAYAPIDHDEEAGIVRDFMAVAGVTAQ